MKQILTRHWNKKYGQFLYNRMYNLYLLHTIYVRLPVAIALHGYYKYHHQLSCHLQPQLNYLYYFSNQYLLLLFFVR